MKGWVSLRDGGHGGYADICERSLLHVHGCKGIPHPLVSSSLIWACPDSEASVGSQEGLGIPVGLWAVGVGQSFQDNYGMQGQGAAGPFRSGRTPDPGWCLGSCGGQVGIDSADGDGAQAAGRSKRPGEGKGGIHRQGIDRS